MKKLFIYLFGLTLLASCGNFSPPGGQKPVGILPSKQVPSSVQEKPIVVPEKKLPPPSFPALPSCNWSRTDGFGVSFWSQKCDIGGIISDIIPSVPMSGFIMEYGSGTDMNQGEMIARVFTTGGDNESIVSTLKAESAIGDQYECSLTPDETIEGSGSILHYSLAPKKQDDLIKVKEQMKTSSGFYPCGTYGINSDETNYFIQPEGSTGVLLYVRLQNGTPVIDEKSITVE